MQDIVDDPLLLVLAIAGVVLGLAAIAIFALKVGLLVTLLVRAHRAGAKVTLVELLGMRLRKVNITTVVNALILAAKHGVNFTAEEAETHFLAGADVQKLSESLVRVHQAGLDVPRNVLTAISLSTFDLDTEVERAITPMRIRTPTDSRLISAIRVRTRDGVALRASVDSNVQYDLSRVVGGGDAEVFHGWIASIIESEVRIRSSDILVQDASELEQIIFSKSGESGSPYRVEQVEVRLTPA